jgi:hypothetical protein
MTLSARYSHALDHGEVDEWLDCWTSDGYFERFDSEPRARGHAELAEMARALTIRGRHITSDYVVTVEGDVATQRSYCLFVDVDKDCSAVMFGTYRDRLRRTPDGWKFQERIFHPDYVAADRIFEAAYTDRETP